MSQKGSGLKAPSKLGRPATAAGIPTPKTGIPAPSSRAQSAIEKSARAAGLASGVAEKYAAELAQKYPGPEPHPPAQPLDDFIIGDRVYVGGTKPGFIAYLGDTQFAPGEWAGIVLDEPIGKNDGSVAGVRYFQCEMLRGVFARPTKLSRKEDDHGSMSGSTEGSTGLQTPTPARASKPANGTMPPPGKVGSTPRVGLTKKSIGGSLSSLNKSYIEPAGKPHLHIGDRVIVSGTKPGVLRYMGTTDFAKGDWAGVELDDAQGKNDGSVAGKRYFDCRPLYGLFAPVHKVAKMSQAGGSVVGAPMATPPRTPRSIGSKLTTPGALSRERSGSTDSISSVSSSASSLSRSRVRLGVTSLNNQGTKASTPGRPSTLNLSATTNALQKALKEKEEHIEQLLRERDMERSEVARAASQVDEAEGQMATMKADQDRFAQETEETLQAMKTTIEMLTEEKKRLEASVEEERRKIEDLQFTIEEEAINKGDLEFQGRSEEDEKAMKLLEDDVKKEKERTKKLEQEVTTWKTSYTEEKARFKEAEDSSIAHLDTIEELTHKLTMAESKIQSHEEAKSQQGDKTSALAEELNQKNQRLAELEDELVGRRKHILELEIRISEMQEEMQEGEKKRQKQQDLINEYMNKVAASDSQANNLLAESQELKSQLAELQRQLNASEEKSQNLEEDKGKLENQLVELMKNSGDSSEQLSLLNQQLIDKDRKLGELQAVLSDSTQKIGKLQETVERNKEESDRDTEILLSKHSEDLKSAEERLEEAQNELDKINTKLSNNIEKYEKELAEQTQRKDGEISDLRMQLETQTKAVKDKEEETEATKQKLDALNTDLVNIKFEKEKVDKQLSKVESERDVLTAANSELSAERDRLLAAQETTASEKGSVEERVAKLMAENEKLTQEKNQMAAAQVETSGEREKLVLEREAIQKELADLRAALTQKLEEKDANIAQLQQELENVRQELNKEKERLQQTQSESIRESQERQTLKDELQFVREEQEAANLELQDTKEQMETAKKAASEAEGRLQIVEVERGALKLQVSKLKAAQEEKQQLEAAQTAMKNEIEDLKQRESKMLDDFEVEKSALQNSVETTSLLLKQKEKELEQSRNDLSALTLENSQLKTLSSAAQTVEHENKSLNKRVQQLENALAESKENANIMSNVDVSGDAVLTQLKTAKEEAEGQIEFLNSVIVDMQRKNEELTQKVNVLAMGDMTNGKDEELDYEANISRKPAPRLFCDICDMFDQHDTDDCPQQAMSESPPASHYHADRKEERAYCTICEVFGHWTDDCDDEQTF